METATASATGLASAVRDGVEEVRYRNGLTVAWLRIGLRSLTLMLWLANAGPGAGEPYREASLVNGAHLAFGVVVLLLLRARRSVRRVLLIAAAADLLVVAFAGLRTEVGDGSSVGYLMGVLELVLLLAALTLPRVEVFALAVAATAFQGYLGIRVGIETPFLLATVLTLGVFSAVATLAGSRIVEFAARRVLDDHVGGLVRAHRDELARANLEISAQRDRVVSAQAESEALSRLIVHDLKNPLAALVQFVSLAESRLAGAPEVGWSPALREAREDLRLAGEEGLRLAAMVEDLMLVSRLEQGTLKPRREATPVAALLEQVVRATALRAADRQVTVTMSADPDLLVPVDLDLVRRLLQNLAGNALRFAERGGRMELAAWAAGDTLALAVRHSGPPIPEALRAHLFEKYVPAELRQAYTTGLGLYLCRLVAEAHGGLMALVEAVGWPVAFEARLPLPAHHQPHPHTPSGRTP